MVEEASIKSKAQSEPRWRVVAEHERLATDPWETPGYSAADEKGIPAAVVAAAAWMVAAGERRAEKPGEASVKAD